MAEAAAQHDAALNTARAFVVVLGVRRQGVTDQSLIILTYKLYEFEQTPSPYNDTQYH